MFWYLNSVLIGIAAWFHPWADRPSIALMDNEPYAIPFVLIEAGIFVLPGLILALLWYRFRRVFWPGAVVIAFIPLTYGLDLTFRVALGGGIFSAESWELFYTATAWSVRSLPLSAFTNLFLSVLLFIAVECLFAVLCGRMARWLCTSRIFWRSLLGIGLPLLTTCLMYVSWIGHFQLAPSLAHDAVPEVVELRHPLSLFSPVDETKEIASHEAVSQHLLPRLPDLVRFEEQYRTLAVTEQPTTPHDTVLVIVESLRADALTPESAPNLTAFKSRSTNCLRHFSTGNNTGVGVFGLLYGTTPASYPTALIERWPPSLTRMFKKSGYHRVFLGAGAYDGYYDMRDWLTPEFEQYSEGVSSPFHIRDKWIIETAIDILNRRGPYAALDNRPVFIVLLLYTTHYPHEAAAEDILFTGQEPMPFSPWADPPKTKKYYLNSVHTIDRLLSPLLNSNAIIAVTGDHGESFGDDGGIMHAGPLTVVRTHTPMIVSVPGREGATVRTTTTHADLFPTLLDVLGATVNNPECITGESFLNHDFVESTGPRGVLLSNGKTNGFLQSSGQLPLAMKIPRLFTGRLFTGHVQVDEEAVELFGKWLDKFASVGHTPMPDRPIEELLELASSGSSYRRIRALRFLAAFPKHALPVRDGIVALTLDADANVSKAATEAVKAIDDIHDIY